MSCPLCPSGNTMFHWVGGEDPLSTWKLCGVYYGAVCWGLFLPKFCSSCSCRGLRYPIRLHLDKSGRCTWQYQQQWLAWQPLGWRCFLEKSYHGTFGAARFTMKLSALPWDEHKTRFGSAPYRSCMVNPWSWLFVRQGAPTTPTVWILVLLGEANMTLHHPTLIQWLHKSLIVVYLFALLGLTPLP